jgi:hypothetical protein
MEYSISDYSGIVVWRVRVASYELRGGLDAGFWLQAVLPACCIFPVASS